MTINITPIICFALGVVFLLVEKFVLPFIEKKLGTKVMIDFVDVLPRIWHRIDSLVLWAKKNFPDGTGVKKMEYVTEKMREFLKENNISMDAEELQGYIEQAYEAMKANTPREFIPEELYPTGLEDI